MGMGMIEGAVCPHAMINHDVVEVMIFTPGEMIAMLLPGTSWGIRRKGDREALLATIAEYIDRDVLSYPLRQQRIHLFQDTNRGPNASI